MIKRNLGILLIAFLRPLLGPGYCRYPISCSQYARIQFQKKSFFVATYYIMKRLLTCF